MGMAQKVLEYLKDYHNTEIGAVKNRDLRLLFNITDRQVRNIMCQLRQDGEPICSSSYGYWYSTDPYDIDRTIHRLVAQVENMNISIAGLRQALGGKGWWE